jgi:hypothetical protein
VDTNTGRVRSENDDICDAPSLVVTGCMEGFAIIRLAPSELAEYRRGTAMVAAFGLLLAVPISWFLR